MDKNNNKKEKTTSTTKKTKRNNTTKNATKNEKKVVSNKKKETKSKVTKKDLKKEEKEIKQEILEEEFDEDLEDFYDNEENEEPVKKEKKKPFKFNKKEEKKSDKIKTSNNKIENITKKVKSNKKNKHNNNSDKLAKAGIFLDKNKYIIGSFIAGVIITTIVAMIIWPDRIATLKSGEQSIVKVAEKNYTANELYEKMKDHYSISQLLNIIDNDILTKLYKETDEMNNEIKSQAQNYISQYKSYYNYTEEQFLQANGFSSYEDFLNYLKLDYRRKKYLDDYLKDNITDKEIQTYYDKNVYGDIDCEHILVEVKSDSSSDSKSDKNKLSDSDAKKLAEEIIDKINDGTSWKDIQKKYKDKVTYENLGYQSWDSNLEESFKDALKDMKNNSYSKEPVKTSYGYHVIYRKGQKDTPSLKKTKDKIIEKIIEEKKSNDSNIQYKALISLHKEKKISFTDTDLKAKYDAYVKQYS